MEEPETTLMPAVSIVANIQRRINWLKERVGALKGMEIELAKLEAGLTAIEDVCLKPAPAPKARKPRTRKALWKGIQSEWKGIQSEPPPPLVEPEEEKLAIPASEYCPRFPNVRIGVGACAKYRKEEGGKCITGCKRREP